MNFEVAAGTEEVAVFDYVISFFVFILYFLVQDLYLKAFNSFVQECKSIKVVSPFIEYQSLLSKRLSLLYFLKLKFSDVLTENSLSLYVKSFLLSLYCCGSLGSVIERSFTNGIPFASNTPLFSQKKVIILWRHIILRRILISSCGLARWVCIRKTRRYL